MPCSSHTQRNRIFILLFKVKPDYLHELILYDFYVLKFAVYLNSNGTFKNFLSFKLFEGQGQKELCGGSFHLLVHTPDVFNI